MILNQIFVTELQIQVICKRRIHITFLIRFCLCEKLIKRSIADCYIFCLKFSLYFWLSRWTTIQTLPKPLNKPTPFLGRACFLAYDDVFIEKYQSTLLRFLKRTPKWYTPKTAAVFTIDHIHFFVIKAPDDIFLVIKVMLILGVVGVLRKTVAKY